MTDNNHPITPPPELVEQWRIAPEYTTGLEMFTMLSISTRRLQEVATQAARWGADQELSECCKWLPKVPPLGADDLRKHRRPKPPSLKEQALKALTKIEDNEATYLDSSVIRRALEQLND